MRTLELDKIFIRQTFELALASAKAGFDPFGALLVKDDLVKASTADKCIQYADPTAHAELVLISEYCRKEKRISLEGHTLYCNVEPCVMCSGAIHWSRISRVVYGVNQASLQKVSTGKSKPDCRELINIGKKQIEIVGPLLETEGLQILKTYPFKSKKERFHAFYGQE